jgi:hypothetical protein
LQILYRFFLYIYADLVVDLNHYSDVPIRLLGFLYPYMILLFADNLEYKYFCTTVLCSNNLFIFFVCINTVLYDNDRKKKTHKNNFIFLIRRKTYLTLQYLTLPLSVPDEGYSRKTLYALNYISTFLL